MKDLSCKKVVSMLADFIDNKLSDDDKYYMEIHLMKCSSCYKKYLEMKDIMKNLHFEYEKLMDEFNKIEEDNVFNIKEYENFHNNISPYIDDELCYEDSIKFRKYLLNSKPARAELANAYNLRNHIKQSFSKLTNGLNFNYSKKIIKRLKNENKDTVSPLYKKAAIFLCVLISALLILTVIGFNYMHKSFAHHSHKEVQQNNEPVGFSDFPSDEDLVEFIFDENNESLLIAK